MGGGNHYGFLGHSDLSSRKRDCVWPLHLRLPMPRAGARRRELLLKTATDWAVKHLEQALQIGKDRGVRVEVPALGWRRIIITSSPRF